MAPDTTQAMYSSNSLRKGFPGMPEADSSSAPTGGPPKLQPAYRNAGAAPGSPTGYTTGSVQGAPAAGGAAPMLQAARSLTTIMPGSAYDTGGQEVAPGEPVPGGGMPSPGVPTGPSPTPRSPAPGAPAPAPAPPPRPQQTSAPTGGGSGDPRLTGQIYRQNGKNWLFFDGAEWYQDGDWWVNSNAVPPDKIDDPAWAQTVEANRVTDGPTRATVQARAAAQGAPAGSNDQFYAYRNSIGEQAFQQRVQWANAITTDTQDSGPRGVLRDEVFWGHMTPVPNMNGFYFSFHGGNSWTFKNSAGQEVVGNPQLLAAAQQGQQQLDSGQPGGGTTPNGGALPNAVDVHGLPLTPGSSAYGLPGVAYGWQTQPGATSNYPYLKHGAVAMPGSSKGVPVIMAEAGVPEIAIPLPKLKAVIGSELASRVVQSVSDKVLYPGDKAYAGGVAGVDDPADPIYRGGGTRLPSQAGIPIQPGAPTPPAPFDWSKVPGPGTNPWGDGQTYTPFSGYTPAHYAAYQPQQMSNDEKLQLSAVSNIARTLTGQGGNLYQIGAPAYADAIKYYQTLLSGNRAAMQAATAGSAEAIRAQGRGLEGRITASLGRSGAADTLKAQAAQDEAAAIARLTQGVQPAAAAALQGAGLAGAQAGAQMEAQGGDFYSRVQQALTQSRQFEENLGEQSRQFGANFEEQSRQFGTQLTEQSRQFGASLAEQVRQGNMSYSQAMAALALNDSQFQQSFALQQKQFDEMVRQFNANLQLQQQQMKAGKSAAKGQAIVGGLGAAAAVVVAL